MKKQVYNPFLPLDEYIPDGEPHIFGDRVYLYGSHDFEGGHTFCMGDYTVYSAPVDDIAFPVNMDSAAITGRFPLRFAILRQADTNIWDMFIIPTVRP